MELIFNLVVMNIAVLISTVQSRPRLRHHQLKNKYASSHLESSTNTPPDERTILKKMCSAHPPAKDIDRRVCMQFYRDSCYRDADCAIGAMCCYNGCVYTCTLPVLRFVKVTDLHILQRPKIQHVTGNGWMTNSGTASSSSQNENGKNVACSTSDYADLVPTLCPSGYLCDIRRTENRKRTIPNRGECIKDPFKDVDPFKPMEWTFEDEQNRSACYYKGRKYRDGQYFLNKCNFCFCSNTIINCQTNPCKKTKPSSQPKLPRLPWKDTINYIQ